MKLSSNLMHVSAVSSPAGQVANQTINLALDMSKERIRTLFHNVDLSISAYDTAWVAMVPSTNSLNAPCFPNSLKWLMDNQLNDGSWGLRDHDPWVKDSLSSTLACILALKRWDVGEDHINKGLCFIESKCASATDMNQPSPVGFDIIFPHMLGYANDLNIKLPFKQKDLSLMLNERELELRRCDSKDREAYLAYVSEGLGTFYDHNILTKYQMKNGSVLNSPSATSAALIHHRSNDGCLNYLSSLLDKFGNAVPTVYPLGLYLRLCMVDALERLGFSRHFKVEVGNVLDETYRCWMQRDDQVFMDINTCALAFRILRMHGYEVSSDPLAEITTEPLKDVYTALEVHKASHVIFEGELAYDQTYTTATDFLKLSTATVPSNRISELIQKEVETALKFPFNGDLERIYARRSIEHYNVNDTRILKTAYRSSNISNEDYVMFAVEDYNATQSIYREEVKSLERWMVDLRLSDLEYARKNSPYCYFSVAATFSSPELADARISWAKNSILVTIVDDFFDVGGSMDEFTNLIHCVEKWDVDVDTDFCSEQVEILFLALKDIISWTRDRSFEWQARDVTTHVIEIWLSMLRNMLQEAIWVRDACMPTINEYMENGYVTIGIGPTLLPSLYFVGPPLSDEIVQSSEYHKLFKIVSTQGRLLNDIRSYKRELKAGKSNAVPLHMKQGKGEIDEEKAVKEIKILIEKQRSKLLKLVLKTEGSIVPRACKDGFWNMSNVLNLFYAKDDGFTGRAILDVVKQVIYEPVSHKFMLFNGIQENA